MAHPRGVAARARCGVALQTLTGGGCTILGCLPGTPTTGEIIVGSAKSSVGS